MYYAAQQQLWRLLKILEKRDHDNLKSQSYKVDVISRVGIHDRDHSSPHQKDDVAPKHAKQGW